MYAQMGLPVCSRPACEARTRGVLLLYSHHTHRRPGSGGNAGHGATRNACFGLDACRTAWASVTCHSVINWAPVRHRAGGCRGAPARLRRERGRAWPGHVQGRPRSGCCSGPAQTSTAPWRQNLCIGPQHRWQYLGTNARRPMLPSKQEGPIVHPIGHASGCYPSLPLRNRRAAQLWVHMCSMDSRSGYDGSASQQRNLAAVAMPSCSGDALALYEHAG